MGMKYFLIIFSLLLILGCQHEKCPSPYIEIGDECCVDLNKDNVCDYGNEKFSQETTTYTIEEEKAESLYDISMRKKLERENKDKYDVLTKVWKNEKEDKENAS